MDTDDTEKIKKESALIRVIRQTHAVQCSRPCPKMLYFNSTSRRTTPARACLASIFNVPPFGAAMTHSTFTRSVVSSLFDHKMLRF